MNSPRIKAFSHVPPTESPGEDIGVSTTTPPSTTTTPTLGEGFDGSAVNTVPESPATPIDPLRTVVRGFNPVTGPSQIGKGLPSPELLQKVATTKLDDLNLNEGQLKSLDAYFADRPDRVAKYPSILPESYLGKHLFGGQPVVIPGGDPNPFGKNLLPSEPTAFINGGINGDAAKNLKANGYYYNITSGNFEKTPTQEEYLAKVAEVAGNLYDNPALLHGVGVPASPSYGGNSPSPFNPSPPTPQFQGFTAEQTLNLLKAQGVTRQDFIDSIVAKEKASLASSASAAVSKLSAALGGSLTSSDVRIRNQIANLIAPPQLSGTPAPVLP